MRFSVNVRDRRALIVLALLLACLMVSRAFAQTACDAAAGRQFVDLINQERARAGLPSLAADEQISQAACKHTALLMKHQALSHQFDGEPALPIRFASEHLRSSRQGENVAQAMDVRGAHAGLMSSPPHRANILSSQYNAVGVGFMRVGEKVYVTEDFADLLPDYSNTQAEAVIQQAITKQAKSHGMAAPARKPRAELSHMACNMALNDALDGRKATTLPGVRDVFAWTAFDLDALPAGVQARLGQPLISGYSLGACFAPSVSHPGGAYWVVMVTY